MILNVPQVITVQQDRMPQPPVLKAFIAQEHPTFMPNVLLVLIVQLNHLTLFLVLMDLTDLVMLTISMKQAVV